jgi:hypothetical protein
LQTSTGELHAFVATPIPASSTAKVEPSSPDLSRPMILPEEVRKTIRARLGMRGR